MTGISFAFSWEVALMQWLQTACGSFGALVAGGLTMLGEQYVMVAILGFLYWCWDKEYGKKVGIHVIVGIVWNPLLKNIVLRRRPYFDHPEIRCLKPVDAKADVMDIAAQGYSFPSGHSTNAAVAYGSLAMFGRKKWLYPVAFAAALLVGVSRFLLGVHYPTDVLAGWALGVVVMLAVPFLEAHISTRSRFFGVLLLTGLPGWFYCKTEDFFTAYGMMLGLFAGILFEERFVRFRNTKDPLECVIRMVGGVVLFFGVSALLKLPFPESLLAQETLAAHLIRTFRYAAATFFVIGLYPMCFPKKARRKRKKPVEDD